jgi:hypothetical protein
MQGRRQGGKILTIETPNDSKKNGSELKKKERKKGGKK